MPSWKKVIVSGSDAALNSLTVTNGATVSSSLTLSGSINNANYIDFNTSYTATQPVAGRLSWNNSDGTLDLGMKGGNVTQQIGEEIFYEVRNDTGTPISNGTLLYANGVTAGSGRITAAPYTADGSVREVRLLGMATEDISNGVNGFVTHFGYVRNLDTRGNVASSIAVGDETWAVGDILYAHPTVAGKLTNVKPKHEINVAIIIVRNQSTGVVFTRPISYGHLDDIHDVNINTGSLSTGDLLIYDSGSDYWINSKQLSGSYGLTGSLSATSFTGSLFGTASYATQALSASFSVSSSRAVSSSFATLAASATTATTATNANTASNITPAITNTANNRVLTDNGGGTINAESALTFDGSTLTTTGTISGSTIYSSQNVEAAVNLRSLNSSGDEGGEIFLNKAVTNTTLTGGVTVDVWQNRLRFFEQGGTARGYFLDISSGSAGVGTNLASGGGTVTSVGGTGTVNGLTLTGNVSGSGNLTLGGTLSNILTSSLAQSGSTIGSTFVGLGSTVTTLAGLTSVTATNFTGTASYATSASQAINSTTSTQVIGTVTGTNTTELVRGNMADNDQFRILVGGTATNAGYVELATADDGTEPIYVRQYTGVFSSLARTATLLDGSGNTQFPGSVSASSFLGPLTGTSSYATSASQAISSSRAISSSFSINAFNATSASHADLLDGLSAAAFVLNSQTSSMTVLSSSFAANASSSLRTISSSFATLAATATNATTATTANSTVAAATFNNAGSGDASGTTFNGGTARTISYNTVGAPSTSGTNATGTWGISITGNALTATSASFATNASSSLFAVSSSRAVSSSFATVAQSVLGTITNANTASNITPAITNTANNRVLTDNGGGTINGESNLTFDGTTLIVVGKLENGNSGCVATGTESHAEGKSTNATGDWSHAEGSSTYAVGGGSHAEGDFTFAIGILSHAEGEQAYTEGYASHAEGVMTSASGDYSHAEGEGTLAKGYASHAEGGFTYTGGDYSHAAGIYTSASADYQSVIGNSNKPSPNPSAFIIGNGTGPGNESNLLYASGSNVQITGSLYVSRSDNDQLSAIFATRGSKTNPAYTFIGDEDTGMYRDSANTLGLTAGSQIRVIASDTQLYLFPGTTAFQENILTISNDTIPLVSKTPRGDVSVGTATSASYIEVTDTTTGTGPYYLMFADGTTGYRTTRVDSSTLTFNATTNTLTVANLTGTASSATSASFAINASSSLFAVSSSRSVSSSFATLAATATTAATASTVTVTDTTTGTGPYYLMFADGTTGARLPRVDSATLTFNATTNTLTVPNLAGTSSFTTNANNIKVLTNNENAAFKVPFASTNVSTTGYYELLQDSEAIFTYNPTINTLTVPNLVGTASFATLATNANNIAVTDTTSGTGPYYLMFADGTTGNRATRVDSSTLTFNATTNTLTVANLTGTASSATSASFAINASSSLFSVSSSRSVSSSFAVSASRVTVATSNANSDFIIPFINHTAAIPGAYPFLMDDSNNVTYNPTSNTLSSPVIYTQNYILGYGIYTQNGIGIYDDGDLAIGDYEGNTTNAATSFYSNGVLVMQVNDKNLYVSHSLGVGTSSPTTTGLIRATNDIIAYYSSDKRLKDNITPIPNALEKVLNLGGYEFDWIPMKGIHENEGHDIGVIAQEVEKIVPEVVTTRDNGYKAVKYEKIVPLLIESIKEQQKQIDELKELVNKLTK